MSRNRFDRVRDVVIYGTDGAAVAAIDLALVCGWRVLRFVDDVRPKGQRQLNGVPIGTARTLAKRDFDLVVVSTQFNSAVMAAKLRRMGFRHGPGFIFANDRILLGGVEVRMEVAAALRGGARAVLFGTGQGAVAGLGIARQRRWQVSYCVDNNSTRWGSRFWGVDVRTPEALRNRDFDLILVCSVPGKIPIFQQLNQMGFEYQRDYLYYGEL